MVFGVLASWQMFMKRCMDDLHLELSVAWVAINQATDNTIVGYSILKIIIGGGGTKIGLSMAPLFANNVDIVILLLKTAAENNNIIIWP